LPHSTNAPPHAPPAPPVPPARTSAVCSHSLPPPQSLDRTTSSPVAPHPNVRSSVGQNSQDKSPSAYADFNPSHHNDEPKTDQVLPPSEVLLNARSSFSVLRSAFFVQRSP